MKVKIYGRTTGCKFCDTAKAVCENNKFDMEFIDMLPLVLMVLNYLNYVVSQYDRFHKFS
ncbi:UNVERIFIED_ORG: hypothetical protein [Escherichia phage CMSTMSU]